MAKPFLRLLGGFDLVADGRTIALPARKARAMLAVLALEPGRAWPRAKLAAMLWEFAGEEQARTSLRQTLSVIRKALPDGGTGWLHADGDGLSLDADALAVDVAEFEGFAGSASVDDLERAVVLYQGDLLDGISLREEAFEDWLRAERGRLRDKAIDALARLVAHYSETGDRETAIESAVRLLALDPLREDIHRALMKLHARQGRTDAALRQYQACREILERELAVEPAAETRALYDAILERRFAPGEGKLAVDGATEAVDGSPAAPQKPLALPDKPSIAALPFDNMSGKPEQVYFSDGITEDVITELSRNRSLFVISRKSSFAYRGSDKTVERVAQELGVRYLLEGSVRQAGSRVRITAQLIDASTGNHIWAERYDRELEDIFAVQDEVARTIVSTLVGRLDAAVAASSRSRPTDDLEAYDLVLRAQHHVQQYTHEEYAEARALLERAIERDPGYARAYGLLALIEVYDWFWDMVRPYCERAIELGHKAIALDDQEALAHVALTVAQTFCWRLDKAEYHIGRAVALNPNDDLALVEQGRLLMYLGDPDAGAERVREAMRLNPFHPNWYWNILGRNLHTAGRFEEAIGVFQRITTPPFWVHAYLAACSACLGRMEEAERYRSETLKARPDFGLALFATILPYKDPAVREGFLDTLRKAGFRE